MNQYINDMMLQNDRPNSSNVKQTPRRKARGQLNNTGKKPPSSTENRRIFDGIERKLRPISEGEAKKERTQPAAIETGLNSGTGPPGYNQGKKNRSEGRP